MSDTTITNPGIFKPIAIKDFSDKNDGVEIGNPSPKDAPKPASKIHPAMVTPPGVDV